MTRKKKVFIAPVRKMLLQLVITENMKTISRSSTLSTVAKHLFSQSGNKYSPLNLCGLRSYGITLHIRLGKSQLSLLSPSMQSTPHTPSQIVLRFLCEMKSALPRQIQAYVLASSSCQQFHLIDVAVRQEMDFPL